MKRLLASLLLATSLFADNFSGGGGSTILGPITSPPPAFSQSAAVTVTGVTVATTLTGAGFGSLTLPANTFAQAGSILRIRAQGFYNQNADVTAFTFVLSLGGTTIFTGSLGPTLATGNMTWYVDAIVTCVSTGTSGTVSGSTLVTFDNTAAAPNRVKWLNATPITLNTTIAQAFDLKVTPGANAQSFTMTNLVISGY